MVQQLTHQIKQLLDSQDHESLKYLITDESRQAIEAVCSQLTEKEVFGLRKLYSEVLDEEGKSGQPFQQLSKQEKNKNIDEYLLKKSEKEENQENILDMMAKSNEKLIYDQHFGFPFYDLVKRIISTSGDLHPTIQAVKSMHSQVQLLYGILFRAEVLKIIRQKYETEHEGIAALIEHTFKKDCEKYHNFLTVYKNIKKTTEEQQDSEEMSLGEVSLKDDNSLHMDEKEFLVELAEGLEIDEFNQFVKNRSYNFLCFGIKKYELFLGLKQDMMGRKRKQFAQLISFVTVRFIRSIVFTLIREKGGGKLAPLKEPLTANQIKMRGNQLTDEISEKVDQFCQPVISIEEEAKALFLQQFQTMNYKDFIPRKYFTQAKKIGIDAAQYTWNASRQYKSLWGQRVRAERYVKEKQRVTKPQLSYIDYIQQNPQQFQENSKILWKKYIMSKFGFEEEKKVEPAKRVKLSSLNH